jgi:tetrapyrrole methylase family protein/MazG family protein
MDRRQSGGWDRLLEIMARLRAPDGCPWDREQTPSSLKRYIVEEAYEVLEAIDGGKPDELAEELGDLLLQIVFQAQLASEAGKFTIGDVLDHITGKLVRRHPHVFGETEVSSSREVLHNWEEIKRREKEGRTSILDGIPKALPSLQKSHRVQSRAASVGFDWRDMEDVFAKLREETEELERALAAGDRSAVADELGDILFAAVNIARHAGVDPEEALQATTAKFIRRFRHVERRLAEEGRFPSQSTLEEMDRIWDEAKSRERETAPPSSAPPGDGPPVA